MSTINVIQVTLELWTTFICLFLAVIVFLWIDFISKSSRCLLNLLLDSAVLLFFDSMAYIFRGDTSPLGMVMTRISNFMVFAVEYVIIVFIAYYCYATLQENGVKDNKYYMRTNIAVMSISLICLIVTQFTGFYYTFDETNHYVRGKGLVISFALGYVVMLYCASRTIRYRKNLSRQTFWALMSYIIILVVASVLQALFYGLSLMNMGLAFSILIMLAVHESEYVRRIRTQSLQLVEQEKHLAEVRTRNILSTIQPHFIFNSLAMISALIRVDPDQSEEAIISLSGFMRNSIDTLNSSEMISIHKELETVTNYMDVMQKRFGDELKMEVEIPEGCDFLIPPFTLQPLVENSIKHGIRKKEELSGTVEIIINKDSENYIIYVKDDGAGSDEIKPQDDGHQHVGLGVVAERLDEMCNGTFRIESAVGKGCCCTITIPYK